MARRSRVRLRAVVDGGVTGPDATARHAAPPSRGTALCSPRVADPDLTAGPVLEPGTRVEVRDAYEGSWNRGFTVVEVVDGGYRVRRQSDGSILPAVLPASSVRRERRTSMWWL